MQESADAYCPYSCSSLGGDHLYRAAIHPSLSKCLSDIQTITTGLCSTELRIRHSCFHALDQAHGPDLALTLEAGYGMAALLRLELLYTDRNHELLQSKLTTLNSLSEVPAAEASKHVLRKQIKGGQQWVRPAYPSKL